MGYIYKITNIINSKVYVGQTRQTLQVRWSDHKKNFKELRDDMVIHKAMFKYGPEAFKFEEIELCDNDLLDERERYWISFYDSFYNGYNGTPGGQAGPKTDYLAIKSLWDDGKRIEDICNILVLERHTISNALKSFGITEQDLKARSLGRPILQYTTAGVFIKKYDSVGQAAIALGVKSPHNIDSCCRQKHPSAYGYLWKFEDDPTDIQELVDRFNHTGKGSQRKVEQYDLDGNLIETFDSCREAARKIGATYHVGISACCLGKQKTAYGYKWKYQEI